MSSRDLLGNSAPTVNDLKVCPSKLAKRVDLTLNVLTQKKKNTQTIRGKLRDARKLLEVMDMFTTVMVVMA